MGTHSTYSPMELLQLYLAVDTMRTLCKNTNKYAAIKAEKGQEVQMGWGWSWTTSCSVCLYALVSLPRLLDYWTHNHNCAVSSHCHEERQIQGIIMEHPPQRFRGGIKICLKICHIKAWFSLQPVEQEVKRGTYFIFTQGFLALWIFPVNSMWYFLLIKTHVGCVFPVVWEHCDHGLVGWPLA